MLFFPLINQVVRFVRFLRRSLDRAGLIPLLVLPVVGLAFSLIVLKEHRQAKLTEYRLLESYARSADVQVAGALDRIARQLHQMAREQLKNQPARDASVFGREMGLVPEVSSWLVTDVTGRIRLSGTASIVGRDVSQQAYFTVHRSPGQAATLFISGPSTHLLGVNAMAFTLPMVSASGEFSGIVGITVGFRFFPTILRNIHSKDSASMSVMANRHGEVVFRMVNPEKFFGSNIAKISDVFDKHLRSGRPLTRHMGTAAQDGKLRLFLAREVGDTGLTLIVSRQLDEVLAVWWRNVVVYALIFVLTAVVVIHLSVVATRRKRQVLAGKAFSDQLIATANIMVVGQDAAGRVTLFNETAQRFFGYRSEEVLGRRWFDLMLPGNAPLQVREMIDRFQQGDDLPRTVEHVLKDKSGQHHIISWQNSVMQSPPATISFGIDVTGRIQKEGDLVAAVGRAENSNAAKSRFLAAISHDVRQPLHAQALFLDVFARTNLSAQQRELLVSANAAATSCGDMLDTLLEFSRVEAGIMTPRLRPFGLQPLLHKIEKEYGPQADEKGIVYRSRETDLRVQSDPMLLELMVRNLVSNAIRYTGRGGLLVTCRRRGSEALLEVWDTGIGISAADQQAVFGEFVQLANPELDLQRGLGLGLAIVDRLARALGHRLSLASVPGRGTVFRLYLPIAPAA